MKRVFQYPDPPKTGRTYWRSLQEAAETPEFQERLQREFPAGAAEFEAGGVSRRDFLKLMGASVALAGVGTAACRRPEGYLVPYTKSPEWVIPGRPLYYASAMPRRGGALPLVVTTFEGRPTHLDGNRLVPGFVGSTDTQAQASLLDMYDPDRVWKYRRIKGKSAETPKTAAETRESFLQALGELTTALAGSGGAGAAILLEPCGSPTRQRILDEVRAKFPQLMVAEYAPVPDPTLYPSLGAGVRVRNEYGAAKRILALDCDFLCSDDTAVRSSQGFADGRRVNDQSTEMNRLYVVEAAYTSTGAMADHRLRLAPSQCMAFAQVFAQEVGANVAGLPALPAELPFPREWAVTAAQDFLANRGQSLFVVGPRQPEAVRRLGLAINEALANVGTTVRLLQTPVPASPPATIQDLAGAITSGAIKTLFVLGGNPVYNAPSELKWSELQAQVETVVRLALHEDETSADTLCDWVVPMAHYLESWGDDYTVDGTYVVVQPMILPINNGISDLEFLTLLNGAELTRGSEFVKATFDQISGGGASEGRTWHDVLKNGFLPETSFAAASAGGAAPEVPAALPLPTPDALEIQVKADSKVDDGRYANNGWLQELPEAITKLTWDNVAQISRATFTALGLGKGGLGKTDQDRRDQFYNEEGKYDLITLEVEGRSITMPAMIAPGQVDNVVTVTLGYGRRRVGSVGAGAGFDAYPLLTSTSGMILAGARVTNKVFEGYPLSFAQMYGFMEDRALVREGTLDEFVENRLFAKGLGMDGHIPPNVSLYNSPPYGQLAQHQWGMVIDLNTCTGCGACTVACQSENNIPIVGKIQVNKGREMHWLRMDRYYGTADHKHPLADENPQVVFQPVACVHCENAPCETVCPVNATIHSEDGLNVMAYNRCIGTRYCANNCPYKARRFNFFDYNDRPVGRITFGKEEKNALNAPLEGRDKLELGPFTKKGMEESLKLSKNPNVTVRMRGVMEKCTYCVQRIEGAKIDALIKAKDTPNTKIPTNAVTTACQDACPTQSIVFGDLADANSDVVKLKLENRNYRIIEYLNTQARTSYLARIRNPNQQMPDWTSAYPGKVTKARKAYDHYGGGHGEGEQGPHDAMPGTNAAGAGANVPPDAKPAAAAPAAHH